MCMKVVIIGKGDMLANLIEGTLDAKCEIVGVLRYERTTLSKWKLKLRDFFKSSTELTLIKRNKIREIKCNSANSKEFQNELLKLNTDVLLVGTWHEKLCRETINLPVTASVNVHPSLLPKYRGPNPYLQTILHRETKSGLTFHLIDKNFDSGSILSQKEIEILPGDTSKELKARTVFQARLMCAEVLKKLEYGLIIPIEQKQDDATYFSNIKTEDMMLDFEKETAEEIHARIRAFHPWLPCYVTYKDKFFIPNPYQLKIISVDSNCKAGEIIDFDDKTRSITVLCKYNKALKMDDIKIYGHKFRKNILKRIIANS